MNEPKPQTEPSMEEILASIRRIISEEDETVLEAGMTFTIEPSIFWPGRVGARIEDIIVVTEDGGRKLNDYSADFVTIDSASASLDTGEGGCAHDHQERGGCLPDEVLSE